MGIAFFTQQWWREGHSCLFSRRPSVSIFEKKKNFIAKWDSSSPFTSELQSIVSNEHWMWNESQSNLFVLISCEALTRCFHEWPCSGWMRALLQMPYYSSIHNHLNLLVLRPMKLCCWWLMALDHHVSLRSPSKVKSMAMIQWRWVLVMVAHSMMMNEHRRDVERGSDVSTRRQF